METRTKIYTNIYYGIVFIFSDCYKHMERTRKRKSRFSSQVKEDVKNDRAEKMRKSIQEQVLNMKNMIGNHNQSGSMAMSRILEGNKYVPSPLLLNEEGQQVDASGKVVDESIELVATVKANRVVKEVVNPYLAHHHVDKNDRLEEMDGRIKTSKRETWVLYYILYSKSL